MRYSVHHITTVEYTAPVRLARFNVRLKPAHWDGQSVSDYSLFIDPRPAQIADGEGGYHVNEAKFTLRDPIRQLHVESAFTVECTALPQHVFTASGPGLAQLRERAMVKPDLSALSPSSYIFASPIAEPEPDIAAWAGRFLSGSMPVMEAGRALMRAIHDEFAYDSKATRSDTPPVEAFRARHGVCQDFSHVMIIAARAHGIPAAYVSGYLRTLPPPGQTRLVGADAMHAWVNLWCGEELGWIGFDPTNNSIADTDHIFIGMGRDYSDVAPLDGTFRGSSGQKMYFSVDVAPLG